MRAIAILLGLVGLLVPAARGEEEREARSVPALVKALEDADEAKRLEAAREVADRSLGAYRIRRLLRTMMLTEQGELLETTAEALEKSGDDLSKTVKALTAQLAEPDAEAQARAAWALSLLPKAGSAAPTLAPLLEAPRAWVRVSAVCALLRVGHEPERTTELLVDLVGHDEARIRLRAIRGLRHARDPSASAVETLAAVAAKGGPDGIQACFTLAALGPRAEEARPTLRSLLEASDLALATAAARAFGALGTVAEEDVSALLDRMMVIGPASIPASVALAAMGEAVVPSLIPILETGDTIRKTRAVSVLEQLGPEAAAAVPALVGLLPTPRPRSRFYDDVSTLQASVIRTLGGIGKAAKPALPALEALAEMPAGQKFQAEAEAAISSIRADR